MLSVLVIGGGPAGACFAARLSELGASVTLVERSAFPRRALGESLSPGVMDLLASCGAAPAVAAEGFPEAPGVRVAWEGGKPATLKSGAGGLLVERGRFDQVLLDHAADQGVRILQPARLIALTQSGDGWQARIAHADGEELIDASFLADARGRGALAGSPRRAMGESCLALFAYWRGAGFPPYATLAADGNGWFWGIPLPDGSYNAQAFVSPRDFHAAHGAIEQRYRALIRASCLATALAEAEIDGEVRAVDATPWLAEEPVTQRQIKLGDAALSLDPISSSGVQKAIQSALAGAIVVNTLLRQPRSASAAQRFYRESLARTAARHAAWASQHHAVAAIGREGPFWAARARAVAEALPEPQTPEPHETVRLSPEARLEESPCLGQEFVEMKQALVHPALDGPVAYLDREALAPLLARPPAGRLIDVAASWSSRMPFDRALAIAAWLRRKGVLVPEAAA